MILKVMLGFDDFEDDAGFCNFRGGCWILDNFEDDAGV